MRESLFARPVALLALGVSCAPALSPVPTVPEPAIPEVTGPPPAAKPSETIAEPVKRPPIPAPPPGVDAEDFAVLASICAVATWEAPAGLLMGCRSAPPFETPEELPDGAIRKAEEFQEVCFLNRLYRGSFSAAGKEQVILGLDACGEDRANNITPGNVVLAEHDANGWHVLAVEKDTNVGRCEISQRPTGALLVCQDGILAMAAGGLDWRFTLDFSQREGSRINIFSKIYQSAPGLCMVGAEPFIEEGVTTLHTISERFADSDGDGDEDLVLELERAYAPPAKSLRPTFDAACAGGGGVIEPKELAGKPKRYTLRFEGTEHGMMPTEATRKLLEAWGRQAPSSWWNYK